MVQRQTCNEKWDVCHIRKGGYVQRHRCMAKKSANPWTFFPICFITMSADVLNAGLEYMQSLYDQEMFSAYVGQPSEMLGATHFAHLPFITLFSQWVPLWEHKPITAKYRTIHVISSSEIRSFTSSYEKLLLTMNPVTSLFPHIAFQLLFKKHRKMIII